MAAGAFVLSVCVQILSVCFLTVALQLDMLSDDHALGGPSERGQFFADQFAEDQPLIAKKVATQCHYPCKCPKANDALGCKSGVNIIEDGCKCCKMCARQQGDLCDYKDKCDEEKGLYCDFLLDEGIRGVCRVRSAKHCEVEKKTYKDGETFEPNCSLKCTCQNGQYACASLCPQEDRAPSKANCKDAQMVAIKGRCCREWVCPHSHSLPRDEDDSPISLTTTQREACPRETTDWTPCSTTCGMGLSIRVTNDNKDCTSKQERRLCLVRPCGLNDKHMPGGCKATWREEKPKKLPYIDKSECLSVDSYQPKYCTTCKKNKCCGPGRTKTIDVQFSCPDGKVIREKMMWIQRCECKALKKCNTR